MAPRVDDVRHERAVRFIASNVSANGVLLMTDRFGADRDERIKLVQVKVRNEGVATRRLRALAMVEWQLGAARGERRTDFLPGCRQPGWGSTLEARAHRATEDRGAP